MIYFRAGLWLTSNLSLFPILDSDSCFLRWGRILSIPHGPRPRGSLLAKLATLPGSGHHPSVCRHPTRFTPKASDLQDPFYRQSGFVVRIRALSDYSFSFLRRPFVTLARLSVVDSPALISFAMALDLLDPSDAILASWAGTWLCPAILFLW